MTAFGAPLIEEAPVLLLACDDDGLVRDVSPRLSKLLGRSVESLLGVPLKDLVDADDRSAVFEEFQALRETGLGGRLEMRMLRANGAACFTRWRTSRSNKFGFAIFAGRDAEEERALEDDRVFREVERVRVEQERLGLMARDTRGKQLVAEAELRSALERFELVSEASGEGLWDFAVVDPHDPLAARTRLAFAPRLSELLGWSDPTLTLGDLFAAFAPEDLENVRRAMLDTASGALASMKLEARLRRVDGDAWVAVSARARRENGVAVRIAGSLRDISLRKEAEESLRAQMLTIAAQRDAIRSLAAPILQVAPRMLVLPLIGVIDAERAADIGHRLLERAQATGSHTVIVDLTGIESVDASSLEQIFQLTRACEVLGIETVVSGIRASVANTIIGQHLDVAELRTFKNLHQALDALRKGRERSRHPAV